MGYFQAAMAIGGGLFKFDMAGKQKETDRKRVQLSYEDNLEKIRRREFTQEQVKGEAQAYSQAAGVRHTTGSSAQGYLDTMSLEFKRELDWMKDYARRAKQLGMDQASISHKTNVFGALTSVGKGAAGIYGASK